MPQRKQTKKLIDATLLRQAAIQIGKEDFYSYCRLRLPKVYTPERTHLQTLCNELQSFVQSDDEGLILNMPPRHGKTLTVELLCEWLLGRDSDFSVIAACYNETLSGRFAKAVRGGIQEKVIEGQANYSFGSFFPGQNIKLGDGAMNLWSLEGSHFSFLATSPGGTSTGLGCNLLVIDDLIKNAVEAYNERVLDDHFSWYNDTMLSRIERGGKQIVIQTRWSNKDLSGRLIDLHGDKWRVVSMPAYDGKKMLAPDMLDLETYKQREASTDKGIFDANYNQKPFDQTGSLYGEFNTYAESLKFERIEAYVDTADTGADYLSGAVYGVLNGLIYILDIIYTQDPMERTEPATAKMLTTNRCGLAIIESNNGGRGFARNVERLMRQQGNGRTKVQWFHQTENKRARILSNATAVRDNIIFPADWLHRWPEFAKSLAVSKESKWVHDDSLDMLTGIYEKTYVNRKKPAQFLPLHF